MQNERIWTLLAHKLAGEATREELNELEELLRENPDLHFSAEIFEELWKKQNRENVQPVAAWERLLKKMQQQGVYFPGGGKPDGQKQSAPVPSKDLPATRVTKAKRRMPAPFSRSIMIGNNLKVTWRSLFRNKTFSFINITGLAIGMAASILILLWIQNELSYDRFHRNSDRIYHVYSSNPVNGELLSWGGTSMLLAPILQLNYPEVAVTARTNWVGAFIFHAGDKHLETQGLLTDSGFLKIFDFPLVHGNVNTALNTPRSLVITESFARKLFGRADALGQTVRIDSNALFTVTGVVKDLPDNTRFGFDYLLPWSYNKEVHWDRPEWATTSIATYVLLKPGVREETANARIANIVQLHAPELKHTLFLHPISKWRLWSYFENGKATSGHIRTVRLFGVIAGLILLIACINYMNLSTARSVQRAKEVGIRKVVGAGKRSLVSRFLFESVLIAGIGAILALLIVQPSLGWFNKLTNKVLVVPYNSASFWLSGVAFVLITGILAGSYPAFYLSAFQPIRVLKGTFRAAKALITPRKILVVTQFTFAIVLIICTIVIYRQIAHAQRRDIGYSGENLAFVYMKGDLLKKFDIVRRDLLNSGAVTSVARTNSPITDVWDGDPTYAWEGKDPNTSIWFNRFYTDGNFVKTMGMTLVAGRDINVQTYPTDSSAILLNESAVKVMGLKDPIGQIVTNRGGTFRVVGVVNDFIPGAPFAPVTPTVVQVPEPNYGYGTLTFRLNGNNATGDNLQKIGSIMKQHNPDYPFDYYFTDVQFAARFHQEKNSATLAALFAGLTIFISCLGLFALAAYMAENRVKEIGVRKVLGASVANITTLLSKDFLKLVLISIGIASPLAWWAMHEWLQHYAYRITISWWVFALAGSISVLIALVTISFQSIKAALANPIRALRSE